MDESLKFVWAYMLQEGKITTGKWNYYSSDWENSTYNADWRTIEPKMNKLRADVKSIGIDWSKTLPPSSSQESCFNGTFSDSSSVEALLGVLVLKDGAEYTVGVSNAEKRFADYLQILNNLMEDKQRVKDLLGE